MSNDVFIACSHLNEYFAEQIENALQESGLKAYLSLDNSDHETDDRTALGESRLMLIVASSPSLNSANIQAEIEVARRAGLPIVAAQIGNLKTKPDILDEAIWVDEHKDQSDENLAAIVAATRAQLDKLSADSTPLSLAENAASVSHEVFVSFSSADLPKVLPVYEALKSSGIRCWISVYDIPVGAPHYSYTFPAVEECQLLLVFVSSSADKSNWVVEEVELARSNGKYIVPVYLESVELQKDGLKYLIRNCQSYLAFDKKPTEYIADVVQIVTDRLPKNHSTKAALPAESATLEETGAFKNIVSKVAGAARLPQLPKRDSSAAESDEGDVATIESAMKFRGVRQSRLFNAVRAGATDVEATDKKGRTALHYAADAGELNITTLLLERGADINAADAGGLRPLHLAIDDEGKVARLLLSKGADVTAKTNEGLSPLDCAINAKKTETKNLFDLWSGIAHGYKSANDALKAGFVASHRYRAQNIIDAIAAGADDLSLVDAKGRNALHWAAREAKLELVERLLKNGADAKATDEDGKTPADMARSGGKSGAQEVILMLNGWQNE